MPKFNIYPPPNPGGWDERGATRRVEVGYTTRDNGGGVQIATSVRAEAAEPGRDFYDPGDGGPLKPAWEGQFVNLDRAGINELIRHLRTARDKAFGADA